MSLKRSNKQIWKITNIIIAVFTIALLLYLRIMMEESSFVNICTLLSLFVFVYELFSIYKITGEIFNPSIIFLASFYVFQNGQLLLIALGINFYMYYINTLKFLIEDVAFFSALSNIVAGLAGVIVAKRPYQHKKHQLNVDLYPERYVARAAGLGLFVAGLVSYPLVIIKYFRYALPGRYHAVRAFEATVPSIIGLAEYLYIPFTFLFIIFSENRTKRRFVFYLSCIWLVLTALCGDRTTGISGLLLLVYINYLYEKEAKEKRKKAFNLLIAGLILVMFIRVSYIFRTGGSITDVLIGSKDRLFVMVFQELGGSVFPLFVMMNIVPSIEPFQYGKQYLLSFFAAIIPSAVDFTGIATKLTQDWSIFEEWIKRYYGQYKFGLGFSLNAEAYINFGWLGIIAIFLLMIVVLSNLSTANIQKKFGSKYGVYKVTVLLYIWMTLPRRSSYYIWNGLFWCVFIMGLYFRVMCLRGELKSD